MKILDLGRSFGYPCINIFEPVLTEEVVWDYVSGIVEECVEKADLVIFGGGEDINPEMYHSKSVIGSFPPYPSYREAIEVAAYTHADKLGKSMFGVCRGMQFLNVMNGGWLLQDVRGLGGDEQIKHVYAGKISFKVNSYHHQVCIPKFEYMKSLYSCNPIDPANCKYDKTSNIPQHLLEETLARPTEAMVFATGVCGVQWHPEYHPKSELMENTRMLVYPELGAGYYNGLRTVS